MEFAVSERQRRRRTPACRPSLAAAAAASARRGGGEKGLKRRPLYLPSYVLRRVSHKHTRTPHSVNDQAGNTSAPPTISANHVVVVWGGGVGWWGALGACWEGRTSKHKCSEGRDAQSVIQR